MQPSEINAITALSDLQAGPGPTRTRCTGMPVVETSIRSNKLGRSVLADHRGRLIAGNLTTEVAADGPWPGRERAGAGLDGDHYILGAPELSK